MMFLGFYAAAPFDEAMLLPIPEIQLLLRLITAVHDSRRCRCRVELWERCWLRVLTSFSGTSSEMMVVPGRRVQVLLMVYRATSSVFYLAGQFCCFPLCELSLQMVGYRSLLVHGTRRCVADHVQVPVMCVSRRRVLIAHEVQV